MPSSMHSTVHFLEKESLDFLKTTLQNALHSIKTDFWSISVNYSHPFFERDQKVWNTQIEPKINQLGKILSAREESLSEIVNKLDTLLDTLRDPSLNFMTKHFHKQRTACLNRLIDYIENTLKPTVHPYKQLDWEQAQLLFMAHRDAGSPFATLPVELVRKIAHKTFPKHKCI